MKYIPYIDARGKMRPGDVIAFSGNGYVSNVIKYVTRSPISHVGVVLQSHVPTLEGQYINQVIESTSLGHGFAGVRINRMSDYIKFSDCEIWWYPLSEVARKKFDQAVFFLFLLEQEGKKYDIPQAIGSALDFIPDNREDLDRLFCSELVAAALEKASVLTDINASEMTPADVCGFDIYDEVYQIKGCLGN